MTTDVVLKIMSDALENDPRETGQLPEIRKAIILQIAEEAVHPYVEEDAWKIFLETVEIEFNLWIFLAVQDVPLILMDQKAGNLLFSLYDRWRNVVNYLIDRHEELPQPFKMIRTKTRLMQIAVCLESERMRMQEEYEREDMTQLRVSRLNTLKRFIPWARFAIIGEGPHYLEFGTQFAHAWNIVKHSHPHSDLLLA